MKNSTVIVAAVEATANEKFVNVRVEQTANSISNSVDAATGRVSTFVNSSKRSAFLIVPSTLGLTVGTDLNSALGTQMNIKVKESTTPFTPNAKQKINPSTGELCFDESGAPIYRMCYLTDQDVADVRIATRKAATVSAQASTEVEINQNEL